MRPPLKAVRGSEFPPGFQWLNTDAPLRLSDLRGRLVLLSFFTSSCINCRHILPDLRRLNEQFGDALVIIGVHSGKFDAERDLENVRAAVARLGISYPVVNDPDMELWQKYRIGAWPTLVLVGPNGRIVLERPGEAAYRPLADAVTAVLRDAEQADMLRTEPLPAPPPEPDAPTDGPLLFPAKVHADEASGLLAIADAGHNRIVIANAEGEVVDVAGTGEAALQDGSFDAACFASPQGLTIEGTVVYVADTDNHALRRLDLRRRVVERIAGTGEQPSAWVAGGSGTRVALNSPWDIVVLRNYLYITMSGSHQIWRMDVRSGYIEAYIGSGHGALRDGTRATAALAQPTGLTTDGIRLVFVDSDASAVRWANLPPGNAVDTYVGAGLYEFGDRDGAARSALLQHPTGIAYYAGDLFVSDTCNNRVKRLNPRSARIETLLGTGERGDRDGEAAAFNHPSGMSAAGGRLFVADTNNHAIRTASVDGGAVKTLRLYPEERLLSGR